MKKLYLLFFLITGCSTYQKEMDQTRKHLADGNPSLASKELSHKAAKEGKNQVLHMLEYGLSLHQEGNFKKSNEVLIAVDRLAEVKDYVSLSRQTGSLLLNESLISYKSERFENLLINAYLALNFTLLGDFENALVECRRIDQKLYKMKLEDEDPQKNFYARYLSATIWEAQRNWDSAYIDYYNAYKIRPENEFLKKDLIRGAWLSERWDDLKKWQGKFPKYNLKHIKRETHRLGELVFIYQQGWIPRKKPRKLNYQFPELISVPARFNQAFLVVDGKRQKPTEMLYQVGLEAKRTLDDDFNYLVAKKILGAVAKGVVAHQVRQKNQFLGDVALLAMHVADQADLRQWSTLPDSFQISRLFLKPGQHNVVVWGQDPSGNKKIWSGQVKIMRGQKTFLTRRTF